MHDKSPYSHLLRLVDTRAAGAGFPDMLAAPVRTDRLAELGVTGPALSVLVELRALRDPLISVVLGRGAMRIRIRALNRLFVDYGLVPQLDAGMSVAYVSSRSGPVAALACRVLPQAMQLLRSGDVERLGVCASRDCAAPFVESAGGKSRSFCSDRCAGRERVRRFRAEAADTDRGPA